MPGTRRYMQYLRPGANIVQVRLTTSQVSEAKTIIVNVKEPAAPPPPAEPAVGTTSFIASLPVAAQSHK